jgi:hypothetical protein
MRLDGIRDRRMRVRLGCERLEQALELAGRRFGQAEPLTELLERFP